MKKTKSRNTKKYYYFCFALGYIDLTIQIKSQTIPI